MKRVALVAGMLLAICAPLGAQVSNLPLSLGDAVAEALNQNAAVVAALREVNVARAQRTQVALAPFQLQPGIALTPDVPGGVGTLQTASGVITQQFSPPGNLAASRSQADASVRAAGYGVEVTRREIALRTTSSYYTLAGAQAAVDIAQQNVSSTEELVRTAQLRQRAGAIGSFEVLRATVELRRVQTDLLRAQSAQNTARVALNLVLGRPADAATTVVEPASTGVPSVGAQALVSADPGELTARAVARDPALQQLHAQIAAQSARARASAALRLPAFSFGVGYQIARAPRSGQVFGAPVVTSGLSLPLFDRGTISGAVREAEAAQSVLEAQVEGRTREIRAEVATTLADISASQARLQFAQTSRAQAEEGLRIAQFGFRQGALGSLDVLSAKNAAVSARGEERQAADDLAAARARLSIILGVSLAP